VTDPKLRASYEACRRVHAFHGKTYYLATLLLPRWKRPYVHALYAMARHADEIVDDLDNSRSADEKRAQLTAWRDQLLDRNIATNPIGPAVRDTLSRWDIPHAYVEAFLASMRMDLTVTEYASYDDLLVYMYGSAVVIGLGMLPVLEPVISREVAEPYAGDLAVAFQLTNFLRDVGEDLRRGRLYLPKEDLAAFGVTRKDLEDGVVSGRIRQLLAFEIARTRELYRTAALGVRLLHPTSRPCIETALTLYSGILDQIERADYQVLGQRVRVGPVRRAAVAGAGVMRAWQARRR
jgi:phytoene synthase